jgi:glycosyltransferase involved in cell wall biosynthesis
MDKTPEVSIITRCRNRLEYTVQVVDAVKRLSYASYEHIIVDNDSSDGTKEWFAWMHKNTSWYDRLRVMHMDRNTGDWGGMLVGGKIARGKYIVQLDNDIIPCEGWLKAMIKTIETTGFRIVMLRRENVAWKLKPIGMPVAVEDVGKVVRVERAVACYMMRVGDFAQCANNIGESQGAKSKYIMAGLTKRWKGVGPIGKLWEKTCIELQADFQRQKYSPKNPEIWEKI